MPVGIRKVIARNGWPGAITKENAWRNLDVTAARTKDEAYAGGEAIIAPYAAAARRKAGSHSPEFASRPDSLARSSFDVRGPKARSKALKMGPIKPIFSAESSFQAGLLVANRARAISNLLIMSLLVRAAAATQTASLYVGAMIIVFGTEKRC